jgi:hypothetical protein
MHKINYAADLYNLHAQATKFGTEMQSWQKDKDLIAQKGILQWAIIIIIKTQVLLI